MQIPCPLCKKQLVDRETVFECSTDIYDPVMMGCMSHYIIHNNGDISIRAGTYWILHEKEDDMMTIHRAAAELKGNRRVYKIVTTMEKFEVKSEEQLIKKIDLIKVFL